MRDLRIRSLVLGSVAAAALGGCSLNAYTNRALESGEPPARRSLASFDVQPRGNERVMVILALSGGGSRAAYFGGRVMLELERAGLLQEVDAISSVSGGSLPAAYYCSTRDPGQPADVAPRTWGEAEVEDLMARNYIVRWLGNQFWPWNVVRYWTTAFDRSDIMAQTFSDNLFDHPLSGVDLELGELNPARPHLILNATNATRNPLAAQAGDGAPASRQYGSVFTFTREDFSALLGSDIESYELGRAVMASATFPAVFQDMTLRDWRREQPRYLHVFDGGNADNLGLVSVKRLIRQAELWPEGRRPQRYVVLSVDAYTEPRGVDPDDPDPRSYADRFVDSNFMDSIDMLLSWSRWGVLAQFLRDPAEREKLRRQQLEAGPGQEPAAPAGPDELEAWSVAQQARVPEPSPVVPPDARYVDEPAAEGVEPAGVAEVPDAGGAPPGSAELPPSWQPRDLGDRLLFWHIEFADLPKGPLRRSVNAIPTNFRLPRGATDDLERAAALLVTGNTERLAAVRAALDLPPTP